MKFLLRVNVLVLSILFLGLTSKAQNIQERMNCPGKIIASSEHGLCGAQVNYSEPFSDIADGELRQVQQNYFPNSFFEAGENSAFYKGVDQQNNNYFCVFTVQVNDVEAPVFEDIPRDFDVETSATSGAIVKWHKPQVIDNCGEVNLISDHDSGDVFPLGKTKVTYWAHDVQGNVTEAEFTVNVIQVREYVSLTP